MIKLYELSNPGKVAMANYENLAIVNDSESDQVRKYITIDTKLTWRTTDKPEEDMDNNLANWSAIVDLLDLKKESDVNDIAFILSSNTSLIQAVIESRTEFLKRLAETDGCGPKRLKLLTDAFRVNTPVITKCTPGAKFRDSWTGDERVNRSDKDMHVFRRWAII